MKLKILPIVILILPFFYPPLLHSAQWVNPKLVIGDPAKARLQQGEKELTAEEKNDIEKYGYTGLEIMTYVDANKYQGTDASFFARLINLRKGGILLTYQWLEKFKCYYKNYLVLLTYDGIRPGDIKHKEFGIYTYPSEWAGFGFLHHHLLTSKTSLQMREAWIWLPKLRRIRENPVEKIYDNWYHGAVWTFDDIWHREPWEEKHKILGEDEIRGYKCLVVESKSLKEGYYLTKRLTWVERDNFLDIHEEQFNREGKLFKIYDKEWKQVSPWNYWVIKEWNAIDLASKSRTVYQTHDWLFDQGLKDRDFESELMSAENIWRSPKERPPEVVKVSDLPLKPEIRWEFWNKVGVKPLVVE